MDNLQNSLAILEDILRSKKKLEDELKSKYGPAVFVKLSIRGIPHSPQLPSNELRPLKDGYMFSRDVITSYNDSPLLDDLFIRFKHY